jgi:ABC-type multidrug transport system fused ATPase/permease subunit
MVRYLITNQAIAAPFTGLIRWQSHFHVVRQSWAFFQNDFAGRISNRVMQTGPAVRQTLVASVTALWYVLVYGITAIVMTAAVDLWFTLPIFGWFAGYVALLSYFVPRLRDRSKISSEARSALMGRIVDSYTNILTVKLFARPRDEDNYVRDAVERHTDVFLRAQRRSIRGICSRPGAAACSWARSLGRSWFASMSVATRSDPRSGSCASSTSVSATSAQAPRARCDSQPTIRRGGFCGLHPRGDGSPPHRQVSPPVPRPAPPHGLRLPNSSIRFLILACVKPSKTCLGVTSVALRRSAMASSDLPCAS